MEAYENKSILLNVLKKVLEKDEDILFAYLYGSRVNSPTHLESDIDIAIYLRPSEMKGFIEKDKKLTSMLITELRTDKIDLRILNVAPFLLKYKIIKEGVPIVIRDEVERVDFETRVMNKFFELKPYLDEYQQMLSLRVKTGV
ncbi:MAG: nucleotidyltransferase domain-containing protein [Thermodesulfobacteriota bacterium]|nr:nucleotidyltransferase domain-containing protein [Thermodesulfobacteriota bacterium]